MKIGMKILDIRKQNNMTQNEFAELFGVSRQAVSNWENNKSYPDLEVIIRISDKFSISLDQLLKEDIAMIKSVDRNKKKITILKSILAFLALVFIIGLVYVCICKYQHVNMYNSAIDTGFKKEITKEFIEKYQGYYAMTEAGVDYLVEPKDIGKLELDRKNFRLIARKGKNDVTIIILENGEIVLSLYPGEVQIDRKANIIKNKKAKFTKEQKQKVSDLLETRHDEIADIVTNAVEKWEQINKL